MLILLKRLVCFILVLRFIVIVLIKIAIFIIIGLVSKIISLELFWFEDLGSIFTIIIIICVIIIIVTVIVILVQR